MESIYKFIEYINESSILSIGLLIFAILYLIYLYNKKEEIENYLGLKLIGFYLLGAFTFNFNFESFTAIIPIGFIIYLAFMKNKERANCMIKKKASIMGLIILCVGGINSIIYNNIEYRERNIPIKNNNIKDLNNKYYFISTNGKNYSINASKTYESEDENFMFSSIGYYNVDIETLLDVISNTKFKKYENASYYTVMYKNEENYYENDKNLYIVDLVNYSTKKLNSKYPIYDAVDISHMPMKQVSEGSWTSTKTDTYLMRYNIDEDSDE